MKKTNLIKVFILFTVFQLSVNMDNVFAAYSIEDYYPAGQGSSWTYDVTRSNSDGSDAWTLLEGANINGFETVCYPDGSEYTGYKSWWWNQNDGYTGYGVERLSTNKMESIKGVFFMPSSSPAGYFLYGTMDSTEPNQPVTWFPRTFDIGTQGDIAYKTYSYTPEGVLEEVRLNTEHYNVLGFEDVTVPAGTFTNALKISYLDTENGYGIWTTTSYFAKGVGEIKWEEIGSGDTLQIGQLTSYTVTPEPISCALFLLGGGAMALVRRKTKKQKI